MTPSAKGEWSRMLNMMHMAQEALQLLREIRDLIAEHNREYNHVELRNKVRQESEASDGR